MYICGPPTAPGGREVHNGEGGGWIKTRVINHFMTTVYNIPPPLSSRIYICILSDAATLSPRPFQSPFIRENMYTECYADARARLRGQGRTPYWRQGVIVDPPLFV